jgi:hypothetical protein
MCAQTLSVLQLAGVLKNAPRLNVFCFGNVLSFPGE